jgi:hypothetical protein
MDLTTYRGSCQCGAVKHALRTKPLTHAMECNCSMCGRAGALWTAAVDADLTIDCDLAGLGVRQFGTMRAKHYFCKTCGVHPFTRPRLDPTRWAVNVRCLEGVDVKALKVIPFDGQNWEAAAQAFMERARR